MFTTGTATKIYLKCTALFTAIFASLMFVFAPLASTIMGLMGFQSFFGIEFTGEKEKSYVNVLLMGVDKSETLSDVMMIAQLNMVTNSVNILQVPRDTYIKNRRSDKKLNSAYGAGGAEKTIQELKTVVDLEIDDYVLVTTSGFRDVIDAVGGVYYDVPSDMDYDDDLQDLHIHLKKGYQLLDGSKAEQYVRYRQGYSTGDLGRIDAQSGFIKEAMRQIIEKNASNSDAETQKLISALSGMVTTSFSFTDMIKYVPYVLNINMDEVNIMRLEGYPEYRNRISYFIADDAKNQRIINEYFNPEISEADLSEIKERDNAIGKNSIHKKVVDAPAMSIPPQDINIYLMDYSLTDGEALGRVRDFLTATGYNVVGSVEARTCHSDKTYCITSGNSEISAVVAAALGAENYTINPELENNADVVVIIGKDMK